MSTVDPTCAYEAVRPSRRSSVITNSVEIAVHEWGPTTGPPVVLLHGWGDCALSYQFMADVFDPRFRLIAFDWRGFGDSQWAADGYWFPDYLGDLDAVLDASAPADAVNLVGHSMGGNVAGLYAGVRPERIAKLVLLEGFGLASSVPADAPGRYGRWLDQLKRSFGRRHYDGLEELVERVRQRAPGIDAGRARFVAGQWSKPTADGRYELKMDPRHRRINPVLYQRAEARACWSATTAPVLAVIGKESDLKDRDWFPGIRDDLEACYPGGRLTEVSGAGHMLHLEQPEAVASLISAFIGDSNEIQTTPNSSL